MSEFSKLTDEELEAKHTGNGTGCHIFFYPMKEDGDCIACEAISRYKALRSENKRLREAIEMSIRCMGDVVQIRRFSTAVDPIRLVETWQDNLKAALAQGEGE